MTAAKSQPGFSVELALLGFFIACWLVFFVLALLGHPFAGALSLGLYQLYGVAVATGWLLGNVIVHRSRTWSRAVRRRFVLAFLLSPGGLFYLLWSTGQAGDRLAVPFAPLYALAVFAVFFLVPVSFRRSFPPRS